MSFLSYLQSPQFGTLIVILPRICLFIGIHSSDQIRGKERIGIVIEEKNEFPLAILRSGATSPFGLVESLYNKDGVQGMQRPSDTNADLVVWHLPRAAYLQHRRAFGRTGPLSHE